MARLEELDRPISVDDLRNLVGELRMMARRLLSTESRPHSLTPTALAMTALRRAKLKEQEWEDVRWENRSHFFSALSLAMRNAIIDHARRKNAKGRQNVSYFGPHEKLFMDMAGEADERPAHVLLMEEALALLEATDKRLADVVQQFHLVGFSTAEIAQVAGVSEKTVDRDLKKGRTLLRKIVEDLQKSPS